MVEELLQTAGGWLASSSRLPSTALRFKRLQVGLRRFA